MLEIALMLETYDAPSGAAGYGDICFFMFPVKTATSACQCRIFGADAAFTTNSKWMRRHGFHFPDSAVHTGQTNG